MSDDGFVREKFDLVYPTPVAIYRWPGSEALNAELRGLILAAEAKEPGLARTNAGGWHSDDHFLERQEGPVQAFVSGLHEVAKEMTQATVPRTGRYTADFRFSGWANVARRGHYHHPHNHPGSVWSGVYYVSIGRRDREPEYNGYLELLDPRAGVNMMEMPGNIFEDRFRIDPEPGLMVVFPSWIPRPLRHTRMLWSAESRPASWVA